MRRVFLLGFVVIVMLSLYSFIGTEPSTALPDELAREYVKTSHSTELKEVLQSNFPMLFNEVNRVDIHNNIYIEGSSLYVVYGKKENMDVIEVFSLSDSYVANEVFPVIENQREFCYFTPELACVPFQPSPIALKCGVKTLAGTCIPY